MWRQKNYTTSDNYIISNHIYEYDIRKANINIMYTKGYIDKEMYQRLLEAPRETRQVEIGYLLRSKPELNQLYADAIADYKRRLFEANNIQEEEIVSIKNDAVFIRGRLLTNTIFDERVEFRLRNTYTSFMKLPASLELYYAENKVNSTVNIDVKGINDKFLPLHFSYGFGDLLIDILRSLESGDIEDTINIWREIYNGYMNGSIEREVYREFNYISQFKINTKYSTFYINYLGDLPKFGQLDIQYNQMILLELYKYILEIYTIQQR